MIYERVQKLKFESSASTSRHQCALLHHCHLISFVFPLSWGTMFCIWPAGFACGPHYCHLAELHYRKWAKETLESKKKSLKERLSSPGRGEFNLHSLRGSFCPALLWISLQTSASLCLKAQFSVLRMLRPFASILTTAQINHSSIWFSANKAGGWKCTISWTN